MKKFEVTIAIVIGDDDQLSHSGLVCDPIVPAAALMVALQCQTAHLAQTVHDAVILGAYGPKLTFGDLQSVQPYDETDLINNNNTTKP